MLVVPLTAGGGTRLKILEAFAAGLPVVSTQVGCEGLQVSPDEHIVVAERRAFAEAIRRLLDSPETGNRIAGQARELVRSRFDWSAIGLKAARVIANVAQKPTSAQ